LPRRVQAVAGRDLADMAIGVGAPRRQLGRAENLPDYQLASLPLPIAIFAGVPRIQTVA